MQICGVYFTTLLKIIRENYSYYLAYLFFLLTGLFFQLSYSQTDISVHVNGVNSPLLDKAFIVLTYIGDGLFATAVVLIIFFIKRKYWLNAALCFSVPALITQVLKRFVFEDHFRPGITMKNFTQLHYVEGIFMNELNSFPSGHSTSAFAVFTFLALIKNNKRYQFIFLIIAALIGYSRIYLLQHFLQDVLAGSVIGISICTLIFAAFENYHNKNIHE